MKIKKTKIKGVLIIEGKRHLDNRGYLREVLLEKIIKKKFKFHITSVSKKKILRGLHFQTNNPQGKFISVIKGEIFDVIIDLRKNSKTFGKVFKIILSDRNCLSLYIPEGFAHAYYSYERINIVYYKLTNYYMPKYESGINLLDKKLKINWPKSKFNISKKDKELMSFQKFCENINYL